MESAKIPANVTCLQWISKKRVVPSTNRATKAIQIFAAKALPEGLIAKYKARVLDPHCRHRSRLKRPRPHHLANQTWE